MSESVFKSGRRRGFAVVYRDVAQDRRLSLKARGLFLLLQSLPEDWQYTISGLATVAGTGKDQIRSALSELLDVGYLVKEQRHDCGGKFAGNIFVLQEEAPPLSENPTTVYEQTVPLSGKPITGKPTTEKPSTENPTQQNKNIQSKNRKPPIVPHEVDAIAEDYLGDDRELRRAFDGLLANRRAMGKPILTERSMTLLVNKLRQVDRDTAIALLNEATERNWLTVFPEHGAAASPVDDARRGRCL